jgi:transcriptional regulator with XRE-family HTH domain
VSEHNLSPAKAEFLAMWESAQQLGWNQSRLAEQLEMSRGGLSGIINGQTTPSAATLKLFRMVLAEAGAPPSTGHLQDRPVAYRTPNERRLAEEIARLPKIEMERVLPVLRSMVNAVKPCPNSKAAGKAVADEIALVEEASAAALEAALKQKPAVAKAQRKPLKARRRPSA